MSSDLTTRPLHLHVNLACYGLGGKQCLLQTWTIASNVLIKVKLVRYDSYKALPVSSVGPSFLVLVLCLSAGLCYPTFGTTGDMQPSRNLIETSAFLFSTALELAEEAGQSLQAVSGESLSSPLFLIFFLCANVGFFFQCVHYFDFFVFS